jgi:hypothetical protein
MERYMSKHLATAGLSPATPASKINHLNEALADGAAEAIFEIIDREIREMSTDCRLLKSCQASRANDRPPPSRVKTIRCGLVIRYRGDASSSDR